MVIVAAIIVGGLFYFNNTKRAEEKFLSPKEAGEKAINYINKNILSGKTQAVLKDAVEESGVYNLKFTVNEQEMEIFITRDAKLLFPQMINLEKSKVSSNSEKNKDYTIGNFLISKDNLCKEEEKPIVYFFGTERCPHCRWEHPIIEKVAEKFKDEVSFHINMDSDKDREVFSKYSTGGVPLLVLGCRYVRLGSGEREGEATETNNLTALLCKLTNNKPSDVCNPVQDLVKQIKS